METVEVRGTDEYGTPQPLYDVYNEEFNFQLDVCASAHNFKHTNFYSILNDGITQPWRRVNWCNPPYSNQKPWIEKALLEARNGNTTVMLVKWDTSTTYQRPMLEQADEIRMIEHRLTFEGASIGANFPNAFVIFRPIPRFITNPRLPRFLCVNYRKILNKSN